MRNGRQRLGAVAEKLADPRLHGVEGARDAPNLAGAVLDHLHRRAMSDRVRRLGQRPQRRGQRPHDEQRGEEHAPRQRDEGDEPHGQPRSALRGCGAEAERGPVVEAKGTGHRIARIHLNGELPGREGRLVFEHLRAKRLRFRRGGGVELGLRARTPVEHQSRFRQRPGDERPLRDGGDRKHPARGIELLGDPLCLGVVGPGEIGLFEHQRAADDLEQHGGEQDEADATNQVLRPEATARGRHQRGVTSAVKM